MGGLIHDYLWWWNYFKDYLFQVNQHVRGSVTLVNGQQEVYIQTGMPPDQVYLSSGEKQVPVCQGDIDVFNALIVNDGFVIYADIKSNYCTIEYLWLYYNPDPTPIVPPRP
jgi:hypothetical protein